MINVQIELLELKNMITEIKNVTERLNIERDMFKERLSNWKVDMMKQNRMKYRDKKTENRKERLRTWGKEQHISKYSGGRK